MKRGERSRSGGYKNRLERRAAFSALPLRSHALTETGITNIATVLLASAGCRNVIKMFSHTNIQIHSFRGCCASSSTSCSGDNTPSYCVNKHVSTMWFMFAAVCNQTDELQWQDAICIGL